MSFGRNPQNHRGHPPARGQRNQDHHRPPRQYQSSDNLVTINITGYNPAWSFRDFQNTINSFYQVRWVSNTFQQGKDVAEIVINSSKASSFLKAVNNRSVDRWTIRAQIGREPQGKMATGGGNQSIASVIRQYLSTHYDPTEKYLNLANIPSSIPSFSWSKPVCTRTLIDECAAYADCKTLSLDNNMLSHFPWLTNLFNTFQDLSQVDLSMNQINDISSLECMSNISHQIQHLRLAGNPFVLQYYPTDPKFNQILYHNDVVRLYVEMASPILPSGGLLFPSLLTLDSDPVQHILQLQLPHQVPQSFPRGQPLFIPESIYQFAINFITGYFSAYDGDRSGLYSFYNDSSLFTLSLPHDIQDPNGCLLQPYISSIQSMNKAIRNILAVKGVHEDQFLGRNDICRLLSLFPQTRHVESDFSVSVVQVSSTLLSIQLTGQFIDCSSQKTREFSRDFIISPDDASPTRCTIRNDMLFISSSFSEVQNVAEDQLAFDNDQQIRQSLTPDQLKFAEHVQALVPCSLSQAVEALTVTSGSIENAAQMIQQGRI